MFSGNWDITSHRWAGVLFGHEKRANWMRTVPCVGTLYL